MIVIVNVAAGGPGPSSANLTRRRIVDAFAVAGAPITITSPDRQYEIASLARRAIDAGEQTIVAAGGDGTINAVASELANSGRALGILPLGTLNHFAKDLHIPVEL